MTSTLAYWILLVGIGLAGMASVVDLKRQGELHHLYYGLVLGLTCVAQPFPALVAFPLAVLVFLALPTWWLRLLFLALLAVFGFVLPPPVGQITALVLVADDTGDHAYQVWCASTGRQVPPDRSPVHQLYAWAVRLFGDPTL